MNLPMDPKSSAARSGSGCALGTMPACEVLGQGQAEFPSYPSPSPSGRILRPLALGPAQVAKLRHGGASSTIPGGR